MSDTPNIWTDGGGEDFSLIGGFEVAGAGVYVLASELAFEGSVWGVAEECSDARLERCRAFMPSVLNSGVLLLPCTRTGLHLGIDNLNVARTVGRLLANDRLVKPLPLVKDGDLVALAQYMIRSRGRQTVRVTEVKGHATDADDEQGRVRLVDQLGNAEADTAADLGRRHQSELIIDAGPSLLKVRTHWYPIMQQLHRFMIAVSRVAVNHDGKGGSAPDPLVWDQGGQRETRRTDIRVNIDLASLPGPRGFLSGPWMQVHGGCITDADIAAWPYSVDILCKFTAFLGTLHWLDIGHSLFWKSSSFSSNGLVTGCSVKRQTSCRADRAILIPSVLVSEGIEIRHGCQFVSSLVRALSKLPGRFLPCGIFPHMSRLRHLGWNQFSHGLSSRPLECGFLFILKGQLRSFWMAP